MTTRYFKCKTQEDTMMGVTAPSGQCYVVCKNQFFGVQEPVDQEWFAANKRYQEKGILESAKPKPTEDKQSLFKKELEALKLKSGDVKVILDNYEHKENFLAELELGRPLPENLSNKARTALKAAYKQ